MIVLKCNASYITGMPAKMKKIKLQFEKISKKKKAKNFRILKTNFKFC